MGRSGGEAGREWSRGMEEAGGWGGRENGKERNRDTWNALNLPNKYSCPVYFCILPPAGRRVAIFVERDRLQLVASGIGVCVQCTVPLCSRSGRSAVLVKSLRDASEFLLRVSSFRSAPFLLENLVISVYRISLGILKTGSISGFAQTKFRMERAFHSLLVQRLLKP
jgi:hypothetical protein